MPLPTDSRVDLPWGEPTTRRERWGAAAYLVTTALLVALVVLAVVFERFAATGVLLVGFLSFVLAYLIAPAVERLRYAGSPSRRRRPLSRGLAAAAVYGVIAAAATPVWVFSGARVGAAMERMTVLVPEYTARFIEQLRASERWHETLDLPAVVDGPVGMITRRVARSIAAEARALGAELTGIRRLLPWLSFVPVATFVMLTRWHRFRRSTTRALPTPHLRWRGDEFLRNLNSVLAAYTRAQVLSCLIIGLLCWMGFAAIGLPYPGTLGLAAGLLEMLPVAGPILAAVVATAAAPDRAIAVLVFLAALRIVQDYLIYPRLISRALHLHPLAVVLALWCGAALGGVVGVCLAIPSVGMLQVAHRHLREYREIERLVARANVRS